MFGQKEEITLDTIDFEWVKSQTKVSSLKKAYQLLERDGGYFQDLMKAIKDRMGEIDPNLKPKEFNKYVDPKLKQEVKTDVAQWTEQIQNPAKNEIFQQENETERHRKLADNEKNKGNEALRSNDLQEALIYYTKSIQYDPKLAASYCNRALVLLKLKKYHECIADCDTTLRLQSDYIKAYHRRGKANFALGNFLKAYKDFKHIIEVEPENSEVNGELRECRKKLSEEEIRAADNVNEFKRVQIVEEDSDQDEQEVRLNPKDLEVITALKQQGVDEIKKGMNMVAVDHLTDALRKCGRLLEPLQNEDDIKQLKILRASIISNIALCYMNQSDYKHTIEYCDILLTDEEYLDQSKEILIKTYLRRALAYEALEKLVKAKQDFVYVKYLDPSNLQASQGLDRMSKNMTPEEVQQFNSLPPRKLTQSRQVEATQSPQVQPQQNVEPQQPVQTPEQAKPSNVKEPEQPKNEVQQKQQQQTPPEQQQKKQSEQQETQDQQNKSQEPKEQLKPQPTQEPPVQEDPPRQKAPPTKMDELAQRLLEIKDKGNQLFKAQRITEAIDQFLQGALLYEDQELKDNNNPAFPTYIVLLTNTCLAFSNQNKHKEVLEYSNRVLNKDPKNLKATYRRALAYLGLAENLQRLEETYVNIQQANSYLELSRKDLERTAFLDKDNQQAQTKLKEVQAKNVQTRMKLKELAPTQAEIPQAKQNNFVESEPPKSKEQLSTKVTQNLTRAKLDQIATNVSQSVVEQLLRSPCPDTATNFEKNFSVFRNEQPATLINYLSQIDRDNFKRIYSNKDLPPELLIQIIVAASQCVPDKNSDISSILLMLQNTKKFDLTVKLLSRKEKAILSQVVDQLENSGDLKRIYKL